MPKLKKKLTGYFTIINNTVLRDKRMGCTERGAYVTLVSMADDWNFSIRGLAAIMPDGVTKISGALKRLEALGYLRRERPYENGKIKDWVYYIYDEPCACDTADDTDVENSDFFDSQDADFSDTENLDTENQYQASEHLEKPHDYIITKEEISKKEVSSDQVSIDQSRPPHESSVEKCSDDGQMDGYMQEKEIYTEVVKSNIEYDDYALWAEEPPQTPYEQSKSAINRRFCYNKGNSYSRFLESSYFSAILLEKAGSPPRTVLGGLPYTFI